MNIEKTEVTRSDIVIKLANGVTIFLSSNEGYIHLSFSGIDVDETEGLIASGFAHSNNVTKLKLANYVDIEYKVREQ